MKHPKTLSLLTVLSLCLVAFPLYLGCSINPIGAETRMPEGTPSAPPTGENWKNLLDEEHAELWEALIEGEGIFNIEDGVMHIPGQDNHGCIAYSPQPFENFEVHLEYKVSPGANSGVFIRSSQEDPVFAGMEIQVLGDHGELPSTHSSGALYDVATPMFNMSLPAGEWNSMRIRCEDSMLTVQMNGWKILEVDLDKLTMPVGKFDTPLAELPRSGYFMVQDHGDEVWYRNVLLREL